MNFPFFGVVKTKIETKLQSMIDVEDKLEYLARTYEKKTNKFILDSERFLKNEIKLADKMTELRNSASSAKSRYESLIAENNIEEARSQFMVYKSFDQAATMVEQAHEKADQECKKVKDAILNIKSKKSMLHSKILSMKTQIEAIRLSQDLCDGLDFNGFDIETDSQIKEIESEIKDAQFTLQAKQQVKELLNQSNPDPVIPSAVNYNDEFEAEVRRIKGNR